MNLLVFLKMLRFELYDLANSLSGIRHGCLLSSGVSGGPKNHGVGEAYEALMHLCHNGSGC
jgi:hypothetical protein